MQARLRAQLGDRSKYSGERRRRSVVVASIVLTITDPLRGSCPFGYYLQAALIRSCGASFACMELTIISRFQRPQASTKSLLHSLFYSFSVLSPKACPYVLIRKFSPRASQFQRIDNQYSIKIVGGRELSHPYRVWFFAEGEGFYPFGDATDLAGEGGVRGVVWLIQAPA